MAKPSAYLNHLKNRSSITWNTAQEDFTGCFAGHLGSGGTRIDILTIIPHAISFDEAEKNKQVFEITDSVFMNIVPCDFLKDIKLRSTREKNLFDIARLEEIRNKK